VATFRIALANLNYPSTPAHAVALTEGAIRQAAGAGVHIICFPECFVPGYRTPGRTMPAPDRAFLDDAWASIAATAGKAGVGAIVGTERVGEHGLMISALVVNPDGTRAGFQDKTQIDPSEEGRYVPGIGRHLFRLGELTFGVAICHEGFRYPETVRWAARRGAHIVFHPHFDEAAPGAYQPVTFADPANSFHEKAMLCRAAENTCFFASVNCASPGSATTSAIVRPDGTLLDYQPYGTAGLLIADIDTAEATGLLATRLEAM
jgi:predicted amidohydrolase